MSAGWVSMAGCHGAGSSPSSGPSGPGPSVLFVVIDTLRADRAEPAEKSGRNLVPNLAAWARGAATFANAESAAPFTMPSVAALMTGLYPDRSGVIAHVPGAGLKTVPGATLAEAAKAAGLATAAVVANPWLSRSSSGFGRGFDVFLANRGDAGLPKHADARTVTDAALELLRGWQGQRFFLWVHYFDPHMPYRPPPANAAIAGAPPGGSRVVEDFGSAGRDLTRLYAGEGYSADEIEATRRLYDGEVNFVDEQFGRLVAGLEASGQADRTITVVVSDHGESLGEHGLFFAHDFTVYEELTHAVLMLRGPSIQPGPTRDLVSLIDVAPTLCRLAALPCRPGADGRDLLEAPAGNGIRAVFAAAAPQRERGARVPGLTVAGVDGRATMVRRGNLKLVEIPQVSGSRLELYDLAGDAGEKTNLFSPADPSPDARALLDLLRAWQRDMSQARPPSSLPEPAAAEEDERTLRSLGYLE